jgi:hypothetical protein
VDGGRLVTQGSSLVNQGSSLAQSLPPGLYGPANIGKADPSSLPMGWQSTSNNAFARDVTQQKANAAKVTSGVNQIMSDLRQKTNEREIAEYNRNRKKTGGFQDLF